MEGVPKSEGTFEMMKQILKAGPNQMETLRRLRTEAAAIDKDVTVRSERIRQTRDFRIRFWFREKTMEQRFGPITLRRERRQNELSGTSNAPSRGPLRGPRQRYPTRSPPAEPLPPAGEMRCMTPRGTKIAEAELLSFHSHFFLFSTRQRARIAASLRASISI
jgi:hypothetical protein